MAVILGIESTGDETAAAVVAFHILATLATPPYRCLDPPPDRELFGRHERPVGPERRDLPVADEVELAGPLVREPGPAVDAAIVASGASTRTWRSPR